MYVTFCKEVDHRELHRGPQRFEHLPTGFRTRDRIWIDDECRLEIVSCRLAFLVPFLAVLGQALDSEELRQTFDVISLTVERWFGTLPACVSPNLQICSPNNVRTFFVWSFSFNVLHIAHLSVCPFAFRMAILDWQRVSPSSVFLAEFKSAALLFLTSDRSDKKNNPLNCCAMLCFPLWYVDSRYVTFLLQAITIPWSPLRSPEKAVTRALLSDTSGSPWRCKGWKETKWN